MQAEKLILETDQNGYLIQQPKPARVRDAHLYVVRDAHPTVKIEGQTTFILGWTNAHIRA